MSVTCFIAVLYCRGVEPNLRYLWGLPVLFFSAHCARILLGGNAHARKWGGSWRRLRVIILFMQVWPRVKEKKGGLGKVQESFKQGHQGVLDPKPLESCFSKDRPDLVYLPHSVTGQEQPMGNGTSGTCHGGRQSTAVGVLIDWALHSWKPASHTLTAATEQSEKTSKEVTFKPRPAWWAEAS